MIQQILYFQAMNLNAQELVFPQIVELPFALVCVKDNIRMYTNIEEDQIKLKLVIKTDIQNIDIYEACLNCADNIGVLSQYFDYLQQIRYFLRDPSNTQISLAQKTLALVTKQHSQILQIIKLPLKKQDKVLKQEINNIIRTEADKKNICNCMDSLKKQITLEINSLKLEVKQCLEENKKIMLRFAATFETVRDLNRQQLCLANWSDSQGYKIQQKNLQFDKKQIKYSMEEVNKINQMVKGLLKTQNSITKSIFDTVLKDEGSSKQKEETSRNDQGVRQKQEQWIQAYQQQEMTIDQSAKVCTGIDDDEAKNKKMMKKQFVDKQNI